MLDSYADGAATVKTDYVLLGSLLEPLYRAACERGDDSACKHAQRAVNLVAYYEGYLAAECRYVETTNNLTVQSMVQTDPDGQGVRSWACQAAATGCRTNNDCSAGGHPRAPSSCTCKGASCIALEYEGPAEHVVAVPMDPLARPQEFRSIINFLNVGEIHDISPVPNKSCFYDFWAASCHCDRSFSGLPERMIWRQDGGSVSEETDTGLNTDTGWLNTGTGTGSVSL